MFKTILIPVDGSPQSDSALRLASRMAGLCDAKLLLVHVLHREASVPGLREIAERQDFIDELSDELDRVDVVPAAAMVAASPPVMVVPDEILQKFAKLVLKRASAVGKENGAQETVTIVRDGHATEAILQCAEDEGADLIVTGSRGVSDLQSLLLGSISHELVQQSACPCLVVK